MLFTVSFRVSPFFVSYVNMEAVARFTESMKMVNMFRIFIILKDIFLLNSLECDSGFSIFLYKVLILVATSSLSLLHRC